MKTPFPRLAAAVLIAAAFSFAASAADSPSVLLQKGIYAEETEGNLDAAIKIYEQIAAEAATNRAVVAQAQYRLAVCYQKQGKKEQAIKLLNELVQRSSSDAEARKAREKLVELGQLPSTEMTVRRIPLSVNGRWLMAISPDGGLLSYQPAGTSDIAVCELSSGKSWTVYKGSKDRAPESNALISPDGRWIAYDVSGAAVYVAKIDGSNARKLYECDPKQDSAYTDAEGWSADSTQVTVGLWFKTKPNRVLSVNIETAVSQEIAQLTNPGGPDQWTLSGDKRYVARRSVDYPKKITILDLKSGREETVVDRDASGLVGWSPGDAQLIFSKNRGGVTDVWASGVKDGKPVGDPELITSTVGKPGMVGITRDGSAYYSVFKTSPEPSELWVMEGFITRVAAIAQASRRPSENLGDEILAANNSIVDRSLGFSASLPTGWTIKNARRLNNGGNEIELRVPESAEAHPKINYRLGYAPTWLTAVGPAPTTPIEIDAWLKKMATFLAQERAKTYPNYTIRPASYLARTIDGHRTLSWAGDYTDKDKAWVEHFAFFHGEKVIASVRMIAPAPVADAIRPAFEQLVASVRLP